MSTYAIKGIHDPVSLALDWNLLPGTTSERKERIELAKKKGSTIGASITSPITGSVVLGLTDDPKPGNPCGALWFAAAMNGDSAIIIEPIGGHMVWVCAVRAGTPVPGLDQIIAESDLHTRLPEYFEAAQEQKVFSTLDSIDTFDIDRVQLRSFAEIVAEVKPPRTIRIAGISPVVLWVLIGSIAIITGLYGADLYFSTMRNSRVAAQSVEETRRLQTVADALVRETSAKRIKEGDELLENTIIKRPTMKDTIAAFMREAGKIPVKAGGWDLISFECLQRSCSFIWKREKLGTILTFVSIAEAREWKILSMGPEDATTNIPVEIDNNRVANFGDFSEDSMFRVAYESKLQEMNLIGLNYTFPSAVSIEKVLPPINLPPPAPGVIYKPIEPLLWKVGTIKLSGKNPFVVSGLAQQYEAKNVSLKALTIDFKSNSWNLELNYATR